MGQESRHDFWCVFFLMGEIRMTILIGSMYVIFTYIWLICMVNVGKYSMTMDPMGFGGEFQ